jgi:orotidine-5'-phosphate decarboxylase
MGPEGLSLLSQVVRRIPEHIPVILDGKRGDIGNTASQYAESLFDRLGADWVTINPYMGYDSMRPFVEYKDKGFFVLCLTSNPGHKDFQMLNCDGKPLYQVVAEKVAYWNKEGNFGLVVGATVPDQLSELRQLAGNMAILIPGVGAQGGSLERAAQGGTADFTRPAVINVCRSVLYASHEPDFAQKSRQELEKLNGIINSLRPKSDGEDNPAGDAPESSEAAPEPDSEDNPEDRAHADNHGSSTSEESTDSREQS